MSAGKWIMAVPFGALLLFSRVPVATQTTPVPQSTDIQTEWRIVGRGANRGVSYWTDGNDKRIFAAVLHWVYALDAATGKPIPSFGVNGRIDLREGLGRDPAKQSIIVTSPGVIYKDLFIVG